MPDFAHRSHTQELLDRPDIPFADIKRNMEELDIINTRLGGHAITLKGFRTLADKRKQLSVCEIGCGGGDNLAAIGRWCSRQQVQVSFIGIDINPHCIEVARNRLPPGTRLITADYRDVQFDQKPDIIFSSLFCHHFSDTALVAQLQWMQRNAATGFFINDLHRHALAYYSIKWLTALFSKSYLVKNDAPLSVMRGFIKREWQQLAGTAGLINYSLRWKWAFRWLLVAKH